MAFTLDDKRKYIVKRAAVELRKRGPMPAFVIRRILSRDHGVDMNTKEIAHILRVHGSDLISYRKPETRGERSLGCYDSSDTLIYFAEAP